MDYYVYALVNNNDRIYVGLSKNVSERLKYHNKGKVFSTKGFRPWKILYKEFIGDRKKARMREKYYKSGCGREILKTMIS